DRWASVFTTNHGSLARAGSRDLLPAAGTTSGEVETIKVHHLAPCRDEVLHELLLRVRAPVDFGEGTELRVRTKDQVHARASPLGGLRLAVASLVHTVRTG